MNMSDRVTISISDGIADVRFNRADKRNALDGEQFQAIVDAGESLKTNKKIRVVVLSGEGASFCAGLDLASMGAMAGGGDRSTQEKQPSASDMEEGRITHLGQQSAWVWQEVPVPVIAAVHGHALGGGCQIALGADIRFAHPDTKFSVRENYWGLVPDMAGTVLLQGLVRPDIMKDIVMSARIFDGREAHEIGVVTRLGKYHSIKLPGLNFKVPFLDQIYKRVSIQNRSVELEFQAVTIDQANVYFKSMILFSVMNVEEETIKNVAFKFISEKDLMQALIRTVEGSIRAFVSTKKQAEVLNVRRDIVDNVKEQIDVTLEGWGYHVQDLQINDITFDEAIMTSMSKVVASNNLKAAAENEEETPQRLQLQPLLPASQQKIAAGWRCHSPQWLEDLQLRRGRPGREC
jgi:enoyl-CoA hydratase/carnithine racemase